MKHMTTAHAAKAALLATAALLALSAPTVASAEAPVASVWSQLWRTPDQRGQALLQKGDAAGAAQAFVDPEHKAHAELQAGDYAGAAHTLNGIDKAEAQYNRGNALAYAGDLQGAIKAYDAALKHSAQHADARYNRDVVAAALKKKNDDKKDGDKQDSKDAKDAKPDNKPGEAKDNKPGDKPSEKPNDKSEPKQSNAPGQQPDKKSDKEASTKPGDQPASEPQPAKASDAPATPVSSAREDATQARRDAESALNKGAQQPPAPAQAGASAPTRARAGANDVMKPAPPTEKQIAQEQWLRAIPDDPGGLLRRKFLIEHMLRQQGQKP